ncbi:MAG TPA: twin transmembrane helix small protein [Steroidobacteraceae bacterium]|nr:twin transmembrane helix small protein [Steroidobacteraceae bacterium]
MQGLVLIVVLLALAGILVSLGSGLFHLSRGRGDEDSAKLGRALTIRISLSIALFLFLLFAWHEGWIAPHPLGGTSFAHP